MVLYIPDFLKAGLCDGAASCERSTWNKRWKHVFKCQKHRTKYYNQRLVYNEFRQTLSRDLNLHRVHCKRPMMAICRRRWLGMTRTSQRASHHKSLRISKPSSHPNQHQVWPTRSHRVSSTTPHHFIPLAPRIISQVLCLDVDAQTIAEHCPPQHPTVRVTVGKIVQGEH